MARPDTDIRITRIKSKWPEREGFSLFVRDTGEEYVFIHFLTPAEVWQRGEWIAVEAGACLIVAPHSTRGLRTAGCDLLHDWFHATGELAPLLAYYGIECGKIYYPQNDGLLTKDTERAELEFVSPAPFSDELCSLAALTLLAHFGQGLADGSVMESPYLYRRFATLRAEAHRRYDAPPTVEEMAEAVGLSPSRFHKLYKSYFGVSPRKDLQNTRIEHARLLLYQPDARISLVAERLGYGSVYHFIRHFRTATGMTPGAYRKSLYTRTDEKTQK